jgi:hypothetical protein
VDSTVRLVIAALLAIEAANTIAWLTGILAALAVYDVVVLAMAGGRAVVSALQVASAWMLVTRALPAVSFARLSFLMSAALLILEIGFRLAPSSVPLGLRLPFVTAYALYAAGCIRALVWLDRQSSCLVEAEKR